MTEKQMLQQAEETSNAIASSRPIYRYTPKVDIFEVGDELVMLADLPGVAEQDLQIEVEQGLLTLEAKVADAGNAAEISYYRQFKLSKRIATDSGQALLKDGVLTLKLQKAAEAKPRKIPVKTLH